MEKVVDGIKAFPIMLAFNPLGMFINKQDSNAGQHILP